MGQPKEGRLQIKRYTYEDETREMGKSGFQEREAEKETRCETS